MQSFKKYLTSIFQAIPLVDGLENNKLIVYTATGIFHGTPVLNDENLADSVAIINSFVENAITDYKTENSFPTDQPLSDNDGCIILSDVTLLAGNNRHTFPVVTLFYDQIIGLSIGNID